MPLRPLNTVGPFVQSRADLSSYETPTTTAVSPSPSLSHALPLLTSPTPESLKALGAFGPKALAFQPVSWGLPFEEAGCSRKWGKIRVTL